MIANSVLTFLAMIVFAGGTPSAAFAESYSTGGFFTGSTFESTVMSGSVQVTCRKADSTYVSAEFNCRNSTLDPVETDFFQGPTNVFADTVILKSELESGEIRKVTFPYDSSAGRSSEKLNLWIQGVGQRPLLGTGSNSISYSMTFKGSVVYQGTFTVQVKRNAAIYCKKANFLSNNLADCESPYSMCNRYFQDLSYCL